jgi:hypothetical protein
MSTLNDFEGFLFFSIFTASISCFGGYFYCRIMNRINPEFPRVLRNIWFSMSVPILVIGLIFGLFLWEFNRSIWSLSFFIINIGICGLIMTMFIIIFDIWKN